MLVHGSGYVQMQMISNSKAEKLVFIILKYIFKSFNISHSLNILEKIENSRIIIN